MSNYPGPPGPPSWQPPGSNWQQPPPPPERRGRKAWPFIALAVAVVAILVGVYLLFIRGDDEGGEVLLEATAADAAFPWTESAVPPGAPASVPTTAPVAVPRETQSGKAPLVVVPGDRTGIYGGSLELTVCDKAKLKSFLAKNDAQRRAWAGVLGISDVDSYIDSVTDVLLAADTRVTNHDYQNGVATPLQSVLQAGTAVLIDDRGVPRVRCQCGNPLLPPVPSSSKPKYAGQPWPGFDPKVIVVVQPAPAPITQITVINVITGGPLVIPVGGTSQPTTPPALTTTTEQPTTRPRSSAPQITRTNPPTTPPTSADNAPAPSEADGRQVIEAFYAAVNARDEAALAAVFCSSPSYYFEEWQKRIRAEIAGQGGNFRFDDYRFDKSTPNGTSREIRYDIRTSLNGGAPGEFHTDGHTVIYENGVVKMCSF